MAKYIRKPRPIEAVQWDGTMDGIEKIKKALGVLTHSILERHHSVVWHIKTKNGSRNVLPGHYVYRKKAGYFWAMSQAELDDYDEVKS